MSSSAERQASLAGEPAALTPARVGRDQLEVSRFKPTPADRRVHLPAPRRQPRRVEQLPVLSLANSLPAKDDGTALRGAVLTR
jgi:hypothetical protein